MSARRMTITYLNEISLPAVRPLAQVVYTVGSIMDSDRWLGLELRHLTALKAVADHGSFGRAAAHLGYTQSAISQQIATLERIVGTRLIDRPGGPKPVALTEAGRLLLRHAESITARLQAAQADLEALSDGAAGRLRVGTYQSVGARILPTVLNRFLAEWPQVDISLRESTDDAELLAGVERGELELTFTMLPLPPGPFEFVELMRDPYVLVVAADSPLASRPKPPGPRELAGLPLIGNRSCRSIEAGMQLIRSTGREPNIVFRSDDNGTVQGVVASGMGVALVPRLTVDEADERVTVIELGDRFPERIIGIGWHRDRHRIAAAEAFVDEARAVCAEYARTAVPA
jgi:DNA-binding transcriptional LysR family regulator